MNLAIMSGERPTFKLRMALEKAKHEVKIIQSILQAKVTQK
jgi:hypothetical protein